MLYPIELRMHEVRHELRIRPNQTVISRSGSHVNPLITTRTNILVKVSGTVK